MKYRVGLPRDCFKTDYSTGYFCYFKLTERDPAGGTMNLQECDRLEGASNFPPWKIGLPILIEELNVWEIT